MDLTKLLKQELLVKCEELGISKCKSKTKSDLIQLINSKQAISFEQPKIIIINENTKNTLNVLDLFCGCGGMSKGLTDAGLNIIAGIGGMSEFSAVTTGIDWKVSYGLFTMGMFVIGWLTYLLMKRIKFEK